MNALPTVSAGADHVVEEGHEVRLTGHGEDRDGSIQSFSWSQVLGTCVILSSASEAVTTFTAPAYIEGESDLLFQLTVTDNRNAAATDEVKISISPMTKNMDDPFSVWNDLEPESWWRDSSTYTCHPPKNPSSSWEAVGMLDLGGSDRLSLIRYLGNGSYLRYGHMGFRDVRDSSNIRNRFILTLPAILLTTSWAN